jgi:hypothetical protein
MENLTERTAKLEELAASLDSDSAGLEKLGRALLPKELAQTQALRQAAALVRQAAALLEGTMIPEAVYSTEDEVDDDPLHAEGAEGAGDDGEGLEGLETTDAISRLRLQPDVEQKARQLKARAPGVRFTSGRRDLAGQARAMAGNVVRNRQWIAQTYRASDAIRQLQNWVNTHPQANTAAEIAQGLLSVMNSMSDSQRSGISRHLSGRAFDIQPGSCPVSAVQALQPQRFLTREGGLVIWHVQF